MISSLRLSIARRRLPGMLAFATTLCACSAQAASFTMYRDPNCGCCLAWATHLEAGDAHDVEKIDHPRMADVKAEQGVPADLRSCHTAIVEGYVIEGHVPRADIERLLRERPAGIAGLAVAGMPMGSPGMEHGDHREPFEVVAFGPEGRTIWAEHGEEGHGS